MPFSAKALGRRKGMMADRSRLGSKLDSSEIKSAARIIKHSSFFISLFSALFLSLSRLEFCAYFFPLLSPFLADAHLSLASRLSSIRLESKSFVSNDIKCSALVPLEAASP